MCLAHTDPGGPCRCSGDSRGRVQAAEAAVADTEREVAQLQVQLSRQPEPLETLIDKRPDLSITIKKLHAAGFSMRIADDIRDPDGSPMLIVGERDPGTHPTSQSPSRRTAPPTPPRPSTPGTSPSPGRSSSSRASTEGRSASPRRPSRRSGPQLPDPREFQPGTPEAMLQKQIDRRGGTWTFPALFDLQGKPVPAKRVTTMYGERWAVYDNAQLTGKPTYLSDSKSPNINSRIGWLFDKGYQVGTVEARAQALPVQGDRIREAIPVRTDGGFDPKATIVAVYSPDNYEQRLD